MTYSQGQIRVAFGFLSVVLAIFGSMACPANAESPSFTAVVVKPKSEKYQSWYEVLRNSGQLNATAGALSQAIKLPTYLFLVAQECGAVNAFYMPDKKAIGTSDHSLQFPSGDVGIERSDDAMSVFTRK